MSRHPTVKNIFAYLFTFCTHIQHFIQNFDITIYMSMNTSDNQLITERIELPTIQEEIMILLILL